MHIVTAVLLLLEYQIRAKHGVSLSVRLLLCQPGVHAPERASLDEEKGRIVFIQEKKKKQKE